MSAAALLADDGVLADEPCLEFGASVAVDRVGGHAVLVWRGAALAAAAAGISTSPLPPSGQWSQVVVHVHKSRPGTWADLARAWRCLAPEGRLLVLGGNDLGIATTLKRLGAELGQTPHILANRARARVGVFRHSPAAAPSEPMPTVLTVEGRSLETAPGVFSAERLDLGSVLLLEHMAVLDGAATLADLGAGCGVLGLSAAIRNQACQVRLFEADHRAVACAQRNGEHWAPGRVSTQWWDAEADPAPEPVAAVVCNPPFHQGKAVDLSAAQAMFRAIDASLQPKGLALVVANRQLPYEADLRAIGACEELATRDGFKLMLIRR